MTLSRVLGGVGRAFIGMGVIILLFVLYQLWGTGIQHARAQSALENDFQSLLEQSQSSVVDGVDGDGAVESPPDSEDGGDDGAPEEPVSVIALPAVDAPAPEQFSASDIDLVWRPRGDGIARMSIPRINLNEIVVEGVRVEDLRKGPGRYSNTPMPGQPGNAAIAGHRTTYGAPFNRIDELRPGDEIYIETIQGSFTYRVVPQSDGSGHFIVSPDRVDVLDQGFTEFPNRLTLTACHPKYSAAQRIIVVAELVSDPVVAVPRPGRTTASATLASEELGGDEDEEASDAADDAADGAGQTDVDGTGPAGAGSGGGGAGSGPSGTNGEGTNGERDQQSGSDDGDELAAPLVEEDSFGEGLNGDRSAIVPSIVWAAAAAMIWFTAWFVGRRWRRWPAYALGFVPFFVVLFVCFVHVDQALPSY